MANDGSVVIMIEGDDREFKSALGKLGKVASGAMKGVVTAIGAVSTALAGAAAYAVKVGSQFETSLAKVGTIADTSVKSLDQLSSEVISLSNNTGTSAAELNEALYSAISAGADTAHATELVEVAVKSAKGGFTDTETAVDGLTSALNAYGMATTDAEGLANKFLVTQNLGKTTFGELASSIGTVAPTANAAGVSVDDLLSSVASLTANGIGTSEAMTGMKAALSNIIKPSSEAQKMAKQLGIDFSTAALKSKGWAGFLDDIKEKTGGNTDQMAAMFGSVEALNTVLTLTSDQGMALMTETLGEMEANTTALDDAYGAMTSTFEGSTAKLKTNLDNLAISIYDGLKEPLGEAATTALGMVQTLQDAFSEGGLTGLVSALGDVFAQLITKIAEQAPAFVDTAVQLIQSLINGIQSNLPQLIAAAGEIISSLANGIITLLPSILQLGIELLVQLAQGVVQGLPQFIEQLPQIISGFTDYITDNLPTILQKGVEILGQLGLGIIQAIPQFVSKLPEIISNFTKFVADNLPQIVKSGVELLLKLAVGIIKAIPQLVTQLPQIITAIVQGIGNLLGGIVECGKQIVSGLWDGIKNAAGWLLDKIKGWAGGILDGIKGFFGIHSPSRIMRDMIGKNLVLGVAEGITSNAKTATTAAGKMAQEVSDALQSIGGGFNLGGQDDAESQGTDITMAFADGMLEKMQVILEATKQTVQAFNSTVQKNLSVVAAAGSAMMETMLTAIMSFSAKVRQAAEQLVRLFCDTVNARYGQFRQTGLYAMQGLEAGLREGGQSAISTAAWIADSIISEMQRALDIHSPSRKMARLVGKPAAEGVGVGFQDAMPAVIEQMRRVVGREASKFSDDATARASAQAARSSPQPIQTVYRSETVEKQPVVEFRGSLAALGRVLEPHIRVESRRRGGNLVKGEIR